MAGKHGLLLWFSAGLILFAETLNLVLHDAFLSHKNVRSAPQRDGWDVVEHHHSSSTVSRSALLSNPDNTKRIKRNISPEYISSITTGIKSNSSNTKSNPWDESSILPQWMKDYFTWHQQELQKVNTTNWDSYHYLLLRCVKADKKCSGAADRLKSIPAVIRMAADANRLLFLAWSRPAPLEEFLVPPDLGLNWTLPDWLADKVEIERRGPKYFMETKRDMERWPEYSEPIARIRNIRGSEYYNSHLKTGEATFDQVYATVWNLVFQPSPAVSQLLEKSLQEMNLQPRQYVAAHIRTMYVSDTRDMAEEVHAVDCASQLGPGFPIYVATDHCNTTRKALAYGQSKASGTRVVARDDRQPILHLDRGQDFLVNSNDWKGWNASDFYPIFVDFYLLVQSKCVAYGVGGFGSWASMVGGNSETCSVNHREMNCTWNSG